MDREIKFRGKSIKTGEWVYGYYYEKAVPLQCFDEGKEEEPKGFIIYPGFADWNMPRPMYEVEVIPETVGQYTGLNDKNDKKIYEGDILLHDDTNWGYGGEYDKIHDSYLRTLIPTIETLLKEYSDDFTDQMQLWENIGNKFDNPELLKEGE